jgi:4-hydroxythreonine-4-phosphate dehydrogenase
MEKGSKPIVGITLGDPAGIGPEISIKTFLDDDVFEVCKPLLIGDLRILREISGQLGINVEFRPVNSPCEVRGEKRGLVELIDMKNVDIEKLMLGRASAEPGRASIEYVEKAVEYALKGEIDALATSPINKKAINMAGSKYIGHTEMLAGLCGVKEPLTMFWVRGVKIFFLTRHMPLIEAIKSVKKARIVDMSLRIKEALLSIGMENPRIAIAALNPHAGEEDLMGREESDEIIPAVKELQGMGLNINGPVPADSVFHQALEGKYDAVLSLYHDQGHIAAKTLDFYGAVAVTLGLPFIRTSVDHGTAYDIAGKGIANPKSLIEAVKLAAALSKVYSYKAN